MSAEAGQGSTSGASRNDELLLDPFEIRVLAVLAEKEALTPDSYPLSLNAIVNGCNQLSSRDPVMSITEATAHNVLQRLMQQKLVTEVTQAGARVAKYEHRMRIKWSLEQDKLAIMAILMLRGPQTTGEIRARCGRVHEFATVDEVEAGLHFLIDKFPPIVARLARAPGSKEPRFAHLLSGLEVFEQQNAAAAFAPGSVVESSRHDRLGQLEDEVSRMRNEMDVLKLQFEEFKKQFE